MWTKEPPKLGLGPIRMWTRLGPKVTLVRYFAGTEEVVGSKVRYLCGRIWRRNFGRSEQSWFLEIYTSFMQSLPESRVTEQFDLDSIIVIWISRLFTIQAVVGAPWCASCRYAPLFRRSRFPVYALLLCDSLHWLSISFSTLAHQP